MPIKLGASDISLNFSKAYLGGTLLWSASIAEITGSMASTLANAVMSATGTVTGTSVKADSTAVLADNSTIRADAT